MFALLSTWDPANVKMGALWLRCNDCLLCFIGEGVECICNLFCLSIGSSLAVDVDSDEFDVVEFCFVDGMV